MGEEKSTRERFYDLVHKEPGENGHWIWLGRRMEDSWGPRLIFDLGNNRKGNNRIVIASRFAYEDLNHVALNGKKLKRLCSEKMCVNPAHFTLWINASSERKKLLHLATTGDERAEAKSAARRHDAKAPYLVMHWAKGVAKELVRQRTLLVAIVEQNQKLLAELMLERATRSRSGQELPQAPSAALAAASSTPLVDVFLATVEQAQADSSDETILSDVLDKALSMRVDLDGSPRDAIDLFRSWLERFSIECAEGDHVATALAFADASERYASSGFGGGVFTENESANSDAL